MKFPELVQLRSFSCIGDTSLCGHRFACKWFSLGKVTTEPNVGLFASGILGIRTPPKFLSSTNNTENNYKEKNTNYVWSDCLFLGWYLLFLGCMHRGFLSRDCAHQASVHTDLQFWVSYELFELNRNWVLLLTQQNCFHNQMYNFWLHKISSHYTIHVLKI